MRSESEEPVEFSVIKKNDTSQINPDYKVVENTSSLKNEPYSKFFNRFIVFGVVLSFFGIILTMAGMAGFGIVAFTYLQIKSDAGIGIKEAEARVAAAKGKLILSSVLLLISMFKFFLVGF